MDRITFSVAVFGPDVCPLRKTSVEHDAVLTGSCRSRTRASETAQERRQLIIVIVLKTVFHRLDIAAEFRVEAVNVIIARPRNIRFGNSGISASGPSSCSPLIPLGYEDNVRIDFDRALHLFRK